MRHRALAAAYGAPVQYSSKEVHVLRKKAKQPQQQLGLRGGVARGQVPKRARPAGDAPAVPRTGDRSGGGRRSDAAPGAGREGAQALALASIDAACTKHESCDTVDVDSAYSIAGPVLRQVALLYPGWDFYVGVLRPGAKTIRCVRACVCVRVRACVSACRVRVC